MFLGGSSKKGECISNVKGAKMIFP